MIVDTAPHSIGNDALAGAPGEKGSGVKARDREGDADREARHAPYGSTRGTDYGPRQPMGGKPLPPEDHVGESWPKRFSLVGFEGARGLYLILQTRARERAGATGTHTG